MSYSLLKQFEKFPDLSERLEAIEKEINNNSNVANTIKESCPGMLHHFYEIVCETYKQRLCEQLEVTDAYWIGDEVGGCLDINDYYVVDMPEIVLLVDNCIGFDEFDEWYGQCCDEENAHRINLRSWIMGARAEMFKEKKK